MSRFDWQKKKWEEKRALEASVKEATCERCGKTFTYHPFVIGNVPRFHSLTCKSLYESEKRSGNG